MEQTNQIQLQLITCPWCYSSVEISTEEEKPECPICRRIITMEDLEYEEHKEN